LSDLNDDELQRARKRLSDALVRFAQKLLFVANNKSLISPPESNKGLIPGIFSLLSRGILGDKFTNMTSEATPWWGRASLEDTDKHTRILQAVGNSILVQADALHQEKIHTTGLEKRKNTEVAVLRHTLGLSAEQVIDRLIQVLEAEQSSKQDQTEKTVSALADAIKQLEELEKKVKVLSDETEPDKQAVAQATKEKQDQQQCVDSLQKAAEDARIESKKTADTIAEIRDVKFAVLEKVEEMDSYASAGTVYGLVHSTLQEKLEKQASADAGNEKTKSLKNAVEDMNDRPIPMDLKLSDSMLPENPSAKDIRDVWITLMEYEHDLALYNGDKHRAKQIMEAIKAARKKREGMIFIRPAMAYLRTSFPATSLQSNPNLTWDNMLGGQMLRSIPFAPQISEFLNPDAKCDARITAEIDKQFWQNINRVRVAGGGNTNYAVVKDDIGNWYVKGYSANPEDIIQSAQNLALFSAAGKMGTPSLVPSALATEPNQVRATPGSTLESMLSKYEEDYREKTEQGYVLLCEIMQDPNTNIRDQIKELWKTNGNAKEKQPELEAALKWSYTQFLETFDPNDKKYKEDISKQRELIIEGIKRLKQFRNDLIWKITNVYRQNGESTGSDASGEVAAKSIVKNVVDGRIKDLLANRKDAIKTYENALMFLAEATQPQEK
jgi:hypothetical protein